MSWGKVIYSAKGKLFYSPLLTSGCPHSMVIPRKMFLNFRICKGEDSPKDKKVTPIRRWQVTFFYGVG